MRARQLTDKAFWTFDGWCPKSAIVAGHETIAMYCTKHPERVGSRNEQELHLLRLSKVPEDVAKVFHSRCACIRLGCRRLLQVVVVVVVVVVVGRTCRCCVCVCVRGRLCFSAAQGGPGGATGEPRGSQGGQVPGSGLETRSRSKAIIFGMVENWLEVFHNVHVVEVCRYQLHKPLFGPSPVFVSSHWSPTPLHLESSRLDACAGRRGGEPAGAHEVRGPRSAVPKGSEVRGPRSGSRRPRSTVP